MKIISSTIYEGRNVYSHKKCIKLDVDLEGYCEIPSKNILGFNEKLVNLIPELKTHRCGIDEDGGFVKRLIEGTYLAHICEHMIIAIQNVLGINIYYGKAREVLGDKYIIVFQYEYQKVAIECAKLAVDTINKLIENKSVNFNDRISIIKEMLKDEVIGPSTMSICNAAKIAGMPIVKLGSSNLYQIGYGKKGRIIEASISNKTSCIAADIACDKLLTKELLELQNIPVAKGAKVVNVINLLKEAEWIGYPVVLKPQFGNKGNGVEVDIKNDKELISAYQRISQKYKDILVEKHWYGDDYRVCIIDYKVAAVSLRVPPYIIGDGIKTIDELITIINCNKLRGEDHEKPLTKIKIDESLIELVKKQGYELNSVLDRDEKILLRKNANLSTGGWAIDYTDIISDSNKEMCIRVAKAIGLDICGIDICTKDISKSILSNGIVMEVNAAPGLRMHLYPWEGKSRDVGRDIINMMYNGDITNIPVIAITGTNGKTTTTRLINSTLCKMGYSVGMTSTEGIYVNNKCIDRGDDTGPDSAKCILLNRDVDIAVLETARGGIIRKGLAYDLADVAVITNVTEDHLGIDGVNTMEDLCKVKSLVAEAVKPQGYVIINADDKWSKEIIPRVKANIIYYSKYSDNELVLNNIRLGKIVIYLNDGYICVNNESREYRVVDIKDIPITLNGKLEFNIENAMAACGGLVGLGIDYTMIKIGLTNFELNSKENSGRFNIYDYNGVRVILDYGHNIEGYKKVLFALQEISDKNIIGVIGIPGDRSDSAALEVGKISGMFLDKIIIKEDLDRRGRAVGEIANIIKKGIESIEEPPQNKIILNEVDAFKEALLNSNKGDTVIVFYEKRIPLIKIIKSMKDVDDLGEVVNSI